MIGKKSQLVGYLVMVQIFVCPVPIKLHSHMIDLVIHNICLHCAACKAGISICYYRQVLTWVRHLYWDKWRPKPNPATLVFCSWLPGSASKQHCSTVEPASKLVIEKTAAIKRRGTNRNWPRQVYNLMEGLGMCYNMLCGEHVGENKRLHVNKRKSNHCPF